MHTALARVGNDVGFRLIYKQAGYDFISCTYYSERVCDELAVFLRSLPSVHGVEKIAVGSYDAPPRKSRRLPPLAHKDVIQ